MIPARGGSKGVPRKNLRLLGGRPLIWWTIEQVAATPGLIPYVSTEDAEIAEVSRAAGAKVIVRPDELAQDTTPTEPVVTHAITHITRTAGRPDAVMLLQATSPLRAPGTLARAVTEFAQTGVDSLVGVVPEAIFLWRKAPQAQALYPFRERPRRQDVTPEQEVFRETGSLYLTRTEIYERDNNRLGGRIGLFVMDPAEGLDIDTLDDFARAEVEITKIIGAADSAAPTS